MNSQVCTYVGLMHAQTGACFGSRIRIIMDNKSIYILLLLSINNNIIHIYNIFLFYSLKSNECQKSLSCVFVHSKHEKIDLRRTLIWVFFK